MMGGKSKLSYTDFQQKLTTRTDKDKDEVTQIIIVKKIFKQITEIFDSEFEQEMKNMLTNGALIGAPVKITGSFPGDILGNGTINQGIDDLNFYGHDLLRKTVANYYNDELIKFTFRRHSSGYKSFYYKYICVLG